MLCQIFQLLHKHVSLIKDIWQINEDRKKEILNNKY